jgi:hypothetical protein
LEIFGRGLGNGGGIADFLQLDGDDEELVKRVNLFNNFRKKQPDEPLVRYLSLKYKDLCRFLSLIYKYLFYLSVLNPLIMIELSC